MVLIVEEQELHVHRLILTLLSPVFKAMLDGHFKEASEDKITLEGKNYQSMVLFLKVLYPPSMFEKSKPALNDGSRLSVMALAEEYQCVNVIKQCIDEANITPGNVLQILPYVVKYHQIALPRMYEVINWSAPTSKLEVLSTLENKETLVKLLFTKCRFLESSIVEMRDAMFSLILNCLTEKKKVEHAKQFIQKKESENQKSPPKGLTRTLYFDSPASGYSGALSSSVLSALRSTAGDSRCGHVIQYQEINKTAGCPHCKEKYKEKFLAPITGWGTTNAQFYFDMLQRGNDIATAARQNK